MDIAEAFEISRDGRRMALVARFRSGHVGVCSEVEGKRLCYVTSRPSPRVFWIAQAWYAGIVPGARVRRVYP